MKEQTLAQNNAALGAKKHAHCAEHAKQKHCSKGNVKDFAPLVNEATLSTTYSAPIDHDTTLQNLSLDPNDSLCAHESENTAVIKHTCHKRQHNLESQDSAILDDRKSSDSNSHEPLSKALDKNKASVTAKLSDSSIHIPNSNRSSAATPNAYDHLSSDSIKCEDAPLYNAKEAVSSDTEAVSSATEAKAVAQDKELASTLSYKSRRNWWQRLSFKYLRRAVRLVYLDSLGDYCVSYAECRKDRDKYFPLQEPYLESTKGCRFLHTKMVKTEFHCCQYCKSKHKLTCHDNATLELEQQLVAQELGLPPSLAHLQQPRVSHAPDELDTFPDIKVCVSTDNKSKAPRPLDGTSVDNSHSASNSRLESSFVEVYGEFETRDEDEADGSLSERRREAAFNFYQREPQMVYHEVDLVEAKEQADELARGLDGESSAFSAESTDVLDSRMTCHDSGTRVYLMADVDAKTRLSIGWGRWWQSFGLIVFFFLHYAHLRNFLGIPLVAGLLKFDRFAVSSPDRPMRLARLGFYCMVAFVACVAILLSGCSSSNEEVAHEQSVKDPVSFEINGVHGDLLSNVQAHINSLAVISKSRVRFYVREISDTATKALRAYGYYNPVIHVNLPDKDKADDTTVVIDIDAGKPLYIRNYSVEILGEGSEYKAFRDLMDNSDIASYTVLDHGLYEKLKSAIHETALSLGFFDGKYISSRIMVYQDQNAADIELIYDSGKRYSFGKLLTDPETDKLLIPVASLKEFKVGEPFSSKRVNNYVQALTQTNYYGSVDVRPAIDKLSNYEVPLEVHLEPRAANNMRIGGGYSTDEGIRVLFEWNKPLLNDRGDSLSTLTTLTQVTQNASVIYKIPHENPNNDFFTINASQLHTELNDTISDRSQLAFHYIADQTGSWRRDYALRLEYEDYDQASESGYALNTIPHLRLLRRESSGGFDPERGYSLLLETLGATSALGDNSFVQVHAVYKGIISVGSNYRLFVRAEQGANFGPDADNVPPSLRFFAGGDNSIRGYGYRDISTYQADGSGLKGAKYLTTGSIEYQFPIGIPSARGAVFLDGGLATDDYTSNDISWGPGVGFRYLSPYGTVRVDFAVGLQGGEENKYQLHFAFGPEF